MDLIADWRGRESVSNIRGAIANVASMAGIQGSEALAGYSASKHGVMGITKSVEFWPIFHRH
jgi:NAD(P)-dependent dehydrogenase (short-subunit alcohol dehydrogenase family)